jgi:hypothetical protein
MQEWGIEEHNLINKIKPIKIFLVFDSKKFKVARYDIGSSDPARSTASADSWQKLTHEWYISSQDLL